MPPATPNSDPITVIPAAEPRIEATAEAPKRLAKPAPTKGAANPPVTPINAPAPIAANPISVFFLNECNFVLFCSSL